MTNWDPQDGFFYPALTLIIDSYIFFSISKAFVEKPVRFIDQCDKGGCSTNSSCYKININSNESKLNLNLFKYKISITTDINYKHILSKHKIKKEGINELC